MSKDRCTFCSTTENLICGIGIGIGIGMSGEDYCFCIGCLESMTAAKFWHRIFDINDLDWPKQLRAISSRLKEVKVLREIDVDKAAIECRFCGGTGSFPQTSLEDDLDETCDVCKGRGYIIVNHTPGLVECTKCQGTGRSYEEGYFYGNHCGVCSGTGILALYGKLVVYDELI